MATELRHPVQRVRDFRLARLTGAGGLGGGGLRRACGGGLEGEGGGGCGGAGRATADLGAVEALELAPVVGGRARVVARGVVQPRGGSGEGR